MKITKENAIKSYKVFNPNFTCRDFQYEVGKHYEHKGKVSICNSGFHACKKAIDCFNYYSFDSRNKVAEVLQWGEIEEHDSDSKVVSSHIEIVREIDWHELLDLVNMGRGNTGKENTGDYNSGDYNSGYRNSGDDNSGDDNSGNYNSGYRNSGHDNSGNYNSGHYNSGNYNSGIFNTNEPKMRAFNKPTNMTYTEYFCSDKYIYFPIPLTYYEDGELKTREYKEAWAVWWKENKSDKMIKRIKQLPNFDLDIFEEITGINIEDGNNA